MSKYLGFMPTRNQEYYFVSYNNEDAASVGKIAVPLANAGIPLWYDYGLEYGEKWEPTIAKRIDDSKAVIMFFTKSILSKQSSFVQKEFKMAAKVYRKKIYVVLMDDIDSHDVPYDKIGWWLDIQDLQCINAFSYSTTDMVKVILKAIGEGQKEKAKNNQTITEKVNSDNLPEVDEPVDWWIKQFDHKYKCLVCGYEKNSIGPLKTEDVRCFRCGSRKWKEIER